MRKLEVNYRKEKVIMKQKFFLVLICFGVCTLVCFPANSAQRFVIHEDTLIVKSDGIKMPVTIGVLKFRGKEYEPVRSPGHRDWIEWNLVPKGYVGLAPIYGEKVIIRADTHSWVQRYSCCCVPYSKVESGNHKQWNFTAQLLIQEMGDSNYIILETDGKNGLIGTRNKDYKPESIRTPLLR
jgi:hypothetical protein